MRRPKTRAERGQGPKTRWLTPDQQQEIVKLADSLGMVEAKDAILPIIQQRAGDLAAPAGARTLAERRRRLREELTAAAEAFARRRAEAAVKIPALREGTGTLLRNLVKSLEALLGDVTARSYLYVVRDTQATIGGALEVSCLVAKTLAEGNIPLDDHGETVDESLTRDLVDAYEEARKVLPDPKSPEGAWVRDYASELLAAAEIALANPPFRRDKRDDALERLIRNVAWLIEWATSRRVAINNRPNAADRGDLFRVVEAVMKITGHRHHSEDALAKAIRRTLKYRERGIFAAT